MALIDITSASWNPNTGRVAVSTKLNSGIPSEYIIQLDIIYYVRSVVSNSVGAAEDGLVHFSFTRDASIRSVNSGNNTVSAGHYLKIMADLVWKAGGVYASADPQIVKAGVDTTTTTTSTTPGPGSYDYVVVYNPAYLGDYNTPGKFTFDYVIQPFGQFTIDQYYKLWFRVASYNPSNPGVEDGVYLEEKVLAPPSYSGTVTTGVTYPRAVYLKVTATLTSDPNNLVTVGVGTTLMNSDVTTTTTTSTTASGTTASPTTTPNPGTTSPPTIYPVFPSWLPAPQWTGYQAEYQDIVVRSQMDSGPGKTRRKYSLAVEYITCRWVFNYLQAEEFKRWFTEDIAYGALWFEWIRPENNEPLLARFKKVPTRSMMVPSVQIVTRGEETIGVGNTTPPPPPEGTDFDYSPQYIHSLWEITGELEVKLHGGFPTTTTTTTSTTQDPEAP